MKIRKSKHNFENKHLWGKGIQSANALKIAYYGIRGYHLYKKMIFKY